MKFAAIAIAFALAGWAFDARAQTPSGAPTPGNPSGSGPGRGRRGQHQPQSPEKIAQELMQKFDADKDGELSESELTQALETLREHRPRRSGAGAAQGNQTAGIPSEQSPPATPGAQGGSQPRPSPEKIAAHMIEKYASDKKGLNVSELATAIAAHRANHGQPGSQPTTAPVASQ